MERLGIEHLCVFGMPRVAFVELAADLGCRYLSTNLQPLPSNPHGYPRFSLRDDPALRREMIAAMRDRGVSISLGEGLLVWEGRDVRQHAADLVLMAELGVPRINTVSFDPDRNRTFDQCAVLAEMAAEVGIETTLEFGPGLSIADLPTALAAVEWVGRPDFRILIDTMHLVRSGSGPEDIAALDPDIIGYVQLCDVPLVGTTPDYLDEAIHERMIPGTGELPLLEILAALPRDLVVGLEVPLRSQAEAGIGPEVRVARTVEAARQLLAQLDDVPA